MAATELAVEVDVDDHQHVKRRGGFAWRELLLFIGPGFMMCIAFLDPGNLAADINQGVTGGYKLMWVTVYGTALAWVIQTLSATLGVATQCHLAQLCRKHYPTWASWTLLVAIEIGVIGTDMLETVGGAIAINGLSNGKIPLWGGVLLTCAITFVVLNVQYYGAKWLEYIMATLVALLAATIAVIFYQAGVNWGAMFKGMFTPQLPEGTVDVATSAIGALIMPHNLYLHSALVLSRSQHFSRVTPSGARNYVAVEGAVVMLLSCSINIMTVAIFASQFHNYQDDGLGLGTVGDVLAGTFNEATRYFWYVGLLASSQASTLTTTYAGQFILTGFLDLPDNSWWKLLVTRAVTMGPSLIIVFLTPVSDDGFESLTTWLNTINSFVLPFAMLPVVVLTSCSNVMGPLVNTWWVMLAGIAVTLAVVGLDTYCLVYIGMDTFDGLPGVQAFWYVMLAVYLLVLSLFMMTPAYLTRLTNSSLRALGLSRCIKGADPADRPVFDLELSATSIKGYEAEVPDPSGSVSPGIKSSGNDGDGAHISGDDGDGDGAHISGNSCKEGDQKAPTQSG